jgi:hypothetical protein
LSRLFSRCCGYTRTGSGTEQATEECPFTSSGNRPDDGADPGPATDLYQVTVGVAVPFVSDRAAIQSIMAPVDIDRGQANG